jgi:hypothetical protein
VGTTETRVQISELRKTLHLVRQPRFTICQKKHVWIALNAYARSTCLATEYINDFK